MTAEDDTLQALLEARARELAAPRREAVVERPTELLLHAGSLRCAVPAGRVREVLAPGEVTALPRRGHELVGLRASRRGAVPLADLCRLAGEPALDPAGSHVVVLDGDEPIGLVAEAVAAAEATERPDRATPTTSLRIPGTVRADGVLALDVDALLTDPRLRAGRPAPAPDPRPRAPQGAPWTSQ